MPAAQPSPRPSTARCPLCGGLNDCAMAAAADLRAAADCWCMRAPVAPQALRRVPPAQRGQACLCPRCARG